MDIETASKQRSLKCNNHKKASAIDCLIATVPIAPPATNAPPIETEVLQRVSKSAKRVQKNWKMHVFHSCADEPHGKDDWAFKRTFSPKFSPRSSNKFSHSTPRLYDFQELELKKSEAASRYFVVSRFLSLQPILKPQFPRDKSTYCIAQHTAHSTRQHLSAILS